MAVMVYSPLTDWFSCQDDYGKNSGDLSTELIFSWSKFREVCSGFTLAICIKNV